MNPLNLRPIDTMSIETERDELRAQIGAFNALLCLVRVRDRNYASHRMEAYKRFPDNLPSTFP